MKSLSECLQIAHSSEIRPLRERAFQALIRHLDSWVPAFVARRLSTLGRGIHPADAAEMSADAIQHLAMRVAQGQVTERARSDDGLAGAWCKQVVLNFVRDELRTRRKCATFAQITSLHQSEPEDWLTLKQDGRRFLAVLRNELVQAGRVRDSNARSQLLDEFLASLWTHQTSQPTKRIDTAAKRRRRGRLLAAHAWARLHRTNRSLRGMDHVAAALGLQHTPPKIEPGVRREGDSALSDTRQQVH